MKKISMFILILTIFCLVIIPVDIAADTFDWRDYMGGNYLTPVKDQRPAGTCWAFAAVGALEAKFDITYNNPLLNLDLSEQHLVSDGSSGGILGGLEFEALEFFLDPGIVTESELPYTASNPSPDWPLEEGWENRTHKVTSIQNWLTTTEDNIKSNLESYGPLVAAMKAHNDWYWPTSTATRNTNVPSYYADSASETVVGGSINHAVLVVGYEDVPSPKNNDGYWIVKNSWGAGWGDSGYGYILYNDLLKHDRIHAITGNAYYAPEPVSSALYVIGGVSLVFFRYIRKKNRK